ncbi:MAG TPA: prepilin-type N-terminal cleavage/methylation domain-containing protein [Deltaproteobacteria bacterium]|jgi:general secretion pathway protein I|nr:prepilin-type N-terminal cleavage/methylation domain-containing protein [Deltaproteobacteria bacterium]
MNRRGFTLIEVLIAMVILSIAFVWLIKSVNQSVDMAARSRFITTSTLLAQKRIADVISSTEARTTGTTKGDFGEDYRGYTYTEKIETTPIEGYYKYTLTLTWGEKSAFETEFMEFLSTRQ